MSIIPFLNRESFDLRKIYVVNLKTACLKNMPYVHKWICNLRYFLNQEFTVQMSLWSEFKSLLTMPNNVLPLHLKQILLPIIWIFTEGEGDRIKSRLPLEIFSTLS